MKEFELVGDITQGGGCPGNFGLDNLGGLLPASVLEKLNLDFGVSNGGDDACGPGAEFMKQNTTEVKKALIRNILVKREKMKNVYLRKRQIKMMEK